MELKPREELLKDWLAALRSGKYEQGKGKLATQSQDGTKRYCCLGVLCEIAGVPSRPYQGYGTNVNEGTLVFADGSSTVLPEQLRQHMKMYAQQATFIEPGRPYSYNYLTKEQKPITVNNCEYTTLTVCNDGKKNGFVTSVPALTFAEIADIIEQYGDRLFYA